MPLQVVALIPAKPGSEDVVRDALKKLEAATQQHQGCIDYVLRESLATPGTFVTVETWQEQADLDAHLQTQDIADALAAAEGHLAGEIAIHPLREV